VRCVRPIASSSDEGNEVRWEVSYHDLETNQITIDEFDAVMVCTGWVLVKITINNGNAISKFSLFINLFCQR
jgi:hypothetical protein